MVEVKENLRRLDALRLYGGDIRTRDENGKVATRECGDPFYQDKDAYRTLNALLFPGTASEHARIFKDGHKLNQVYLAQMEKTIQLYCDVFYLMCKARNAKESSEIVAMRVERLSAWEEYEQGRTSSFVSASKAGYKKQFAASKDEVILLEIHIPSTIPHLDFRSILGGDYKYQEEKEVLLPPFVKVSWEKQRLEVKEKRNIRDKNGMPPKNKYKICAKVFPDFGTFDDSISKEKLFFEICEQNEMAVKALEAMNNGEWRRDFLEYTEWKEKLQLYLKRTFSDMWYRG